MACAAHSASMPSTVCALRITSSSLSAAVMPMLTWSSWSPELGIESTLAGWQRILFSATSAAAVYWTIM